MISRACLCASPLIFGMLSSCGVSAANLPDLGSPPAAAPKSDPETCHRLQQDFDIDLKQVVKAGCDPSTEQIAKLMDNPVDNLVLLFNQFDYSALKGPHSNGTRYLGKYSFMPTFPISIGEDWNLINRIPLSYVSAPVNAKAGNLIGMSPYGVLTDRDFPSVVNDPFDRTSGFGDMAYVGVFSPKQPIRFANGGKLPVRISGEVQYSVIHADDQISPRWNLRLSFIPVIPTFML